MSGETQGLDTQSIRAMLDLSSEDTENDTLVFRLCDEVDRLAQENAILREAAAGAQDSVYSAYVTVDAQMKVLTKQVKAARKIAADMRAWENPLGRFLANALDEALEGSK